MSYRALLKSGKRRLFGAMASLVEVRAPQVCEDLEAIVARCGGSLEHETHVPHVDYSLPACCTPEVTRFFSRFASMDFPREVIGHLPGGRVFGSGAVIAPDGRSVARDVSVDFGEPFDHHWLLQRKVLPRPTRVRGTTLVTASAASVAYYHWVFDELPRLLVAAEQGFDTIIGNICTPSSRQALELLGHAGKVIVPSVDSHFRCEHLIVPSLVGKTGHPTPKSVEVLSRFAEPLYRDSTPFGERIYLSRAKATRRRVLHEEDLWSRLEPLGFTKLILEEIPWKEQVNAFHNARAIVAPHGAGLANLVFCRPGTTVVEFFNRGYVHWVFWQLASLRGLDYRPVVPVADEPLMHDFANNRKDLTVEVARVMEAWDAAPVPERQLPDPGQIIKALDD